MKVKSLDLIFGPSPDCLMNWYQVNAANRDAVVGKNALAPDDVALELPGNRAQKVIVTNFMPDAQRPAVAGVRTRLRVLGHHLFLNDHWEGGSRVTALTAWAAKHPQLQEVSGRQDAEDKTRGEERTDQNRPPLAEYILTVVRAAKYDVLDRRLTPAQINESIQRMVVELQRWKTVQDARGYLTQADQALIGDVRNEATEAYNFAAIPENDRFYVTGPTKARGRDAAAGATELRTELAEVKRHVVESTEFFDYEGWRNLFIMYNATRLYDRISGAKATSTIATVHPGKLVKLDEELEKYFGVPYAAFAETSKATDDSAKSYIFDLYDKDMKPAGRNITNKENVYQRFRKIGNPPVLLPNGQDGQYLRYERGRKEYVYGGSDNREYRFEKSQQDNIVRATYQRHYNNWMKNVGLPGLEKEPGMENTSEGARRAIATAVYDWQRLGGDPTMASELVKPFVTKEWAQPPKMAKDVCPVSRSVRGAIRDLVDKFLIETPPAIVERNRPQDHRQVRELADLVEAEVLNLYMPIWERVVNVLDAKDREIIIQEGIQDLLKETGAGVATAAERDALTKLQANGEKQLRTAVGNLIRHRAVVKYCESSINPVPPGLDAERYAQSNEGYKYQAWINYKRSEAVAPEEKDQLAQKLVRDATEFIDKREGGWDGLVPEQYRAENVNKYFHERVLREMNKLTRLYTGEDVKLENLREAGSYLPFELIKSTYSSLGTRFKEFLTLDRPLPYVARSDEMEDRPAIAYSAAKESRIKVTGRDFITAQKDGNVAERRAKFAGATDANINPALKGMSSRAIEIYEFISAGGGDGYSGAEIADLQSALEARAKGVIDADVEELLSSRKGEVLSKEEAKRLLELTQAQRHDVGGI